MSASANTNTNTNTKASKKAAVTTMTPMTTEEIVPGFTALQRQIVDLLAESRYIGVKNVKGVWQFMEKGKGKGGKSSAGGSKSPALLIPFEPRNVDMSLCHAIVSNNKLFTQCQKKLDPSSSELYCNYCLKNGKEGTVEDRMATDLYTWVSARGVHPTRYIDVLKTKYKENWETVLSQVQDHVGFALNVEHLVSSSPASPGGTTKPPSTEKEEKEEKEENDVVLDDLVDVFITVNGLKKKYLYDEETGKVFGYVSHRYYGIYNDKTDSIDRNKTDMLEVDDIIHEEDEDKEGDEDEDEEEDGDEEEVNENDYVDLVYNKKSYKVNKHTGEAHTLDKDNTLSVPKYIYNFDKKTMKKIPTN